MIKKTVLKTLVTLITCVVGASFAIAQDVTPQPPNGQNPQGFKSGDQRGDILKELGLAKEQIQQVRRINMAQKPLLEAAQLRFREANKSLDEAIYADEFNEQDFQVRLKESQIAQSELAKLRFTKELAIRQVLTPEQLMRFRAFRQRFAELREEMQNRERPVNEKRRIRREQRQSQPLSPINNVIKSRRTQ